MKDEFRIEKIRMQAVGPFVDTSLSFPMQQDPLLGDAHIIVGKNGSGKSTVLRATAATLSDASALRLPLQSHSRTTELELCTSWGRSVLSKKRDEEEGALAAR